MSPDREWSYIYHCFTCNKRLTKEFFNSHKTLNHQVESYISMPKNIEKRTAPIQEVITGTLKDEIRSDLADLEDVVDDESWEG